MGKACRVKKRTQTHNKRKRFMGNVHNSVNNDIVSDSVNIELPTINSNAAIITCVIEPNIENPLSLSTSAHKVLKLRRYNYF